MIDDGHAVHYTAVERGTPVFSSDEVELGTVEQVARQLQGAHLRRDRACGRSDGDFRFVDAPEVKRTAERAVTLTITAAEAEELPPPEPGGFKEFEVRQRRAASWPRSSAGLAGRRVVKCARPS